MKKNFSAIVSTFLFLALTVTGLFAQGKQVNTSTPELMTKLDDYGSIMWPEGADVKVYLIGAGFNLEETAAILTSLANWNEVAATSSRVTLTYSGLATEPQDCTNCLTIMRGKVFNKGRHAAELHASVIQGEPTILHARIVIDPVVPNLGSLKNAVAHELGHNFGLFDCFSCDRGKTIMNPIRAANGLDRPTAADVAQVRKLYDAFRIRRAAAAKKLEAKRIAALVPVDEGEEPDLDDTPIVVKKP
ncbi:MAG TPA: hypothetical protein VJT50_00160 [Pyrinomonadaceae bacterium]|nr:hypothetical protein [Pyrinomonadaceae bacterium]